MRLITAEFAKGAGHIIRGDAVVLMAAAIMVLVLPKSVSVEDYGYWQYYLLLGSYVHLAGFGWSEGISLRYSGLRFDDIDVGVFRNQLLLFSIALAIPASMVFLGAFYLVDEATRSVVQLLALSLPVTNLRYFLLYALQATQRMRESSFIVMLDRLLLLFFVVLVIAFSDRTFFWLVLASLAARTISFVPALYYTVFAAREPLKLRPFSRSSFHEMCENISGGYKVLLAGLAGLSVIGIARFAVEDRWGIETFASFSLALAITNLFLVFVNSVGIASFPHLRQLDYDVLSSALSGGRLYLSLASAIFLATFFPLAVVFSEWLPDYPDVPTTLALIFPLIVFEARQSVLLVPLLKTLRLESLLLRINVAALLLSVLATLLASYVIESLRATLLVVVVVSGLRALVSDQILARRLRAECGARVWATDIVVVVTFLMAASSYTHTIGGAVGYAIVVSILLFSKRTEIVFAARKGRMLWRRR